ncbi:MAG: hypothetical protein GXX90_04795 [Microbacteriaceae bacterium]|nr:hypothetical protein [Microbacteriaceae bacterium]
MRRLIALGLFVLSIVGVVVVMQLAERGLPESAVGPAVGALVVLFIASAIWFAVESFLRGDL